MIIIKVSTNPFIPQHALNIYHDFVYFSSISLHYSPDSCFQNLLDTSTSLLGIINISRPKGSALPKTFPKSIILDFSFLTPYFSSDLSPITLGFISKMHVESISLFLFLCGLIIPNPQQLSSVLLQLLPKWSMCLELPDLHIGVNKLQYFTT